AGLFLAYVAPIAFMGGMGSASAFSRLLGFSTVLLLVTLTLLWILISFLSNVLPSGDPASAPGTHGSSSAGFVTATRGLSKRACRPSCTTGDDDRSPHSLVLVDLPGDGRRVDLMAREEVGARGVDHEPEHEGGVRVDVVIDSAKQGIVAAKPGQVPP